MSTRLNRRDVVRAFPIVLMGSALGGLGRFLAGCSEEDPGGPIRGSGTTPYAPVPPTDQDEYVAPNGAPPTNAGDAPPTLPVQTWEARARQLEEEQARLYGPVFTRAAPGSMAGKENSHEPQVTKLEEGGYKKVVILVAHVMGKNGLDAGAYDAGADSGVRDASADADAARSDAGMDAAPPAVDAGSLPVHYITTMYLRAMVGGKDTVVGLWEFASTDPAPPSVKFTLPPGITEVVAYEWCTLHGLWKANPLAI